jgi:hypothetical protein
MSDPKRDFYLLGKQSEDVTSNGKSMSHQVEDKSLSKRGMLSFPRNFPFLSLSFFTYYHHGYLISEIIFKLCSSRKLNAIKFLFYCGSPLALSQNKSLSFFLYDAFN